MSKTILNFDQKTQEFSVNQSVFDALDFRGMATDELFNTKKSHVIIKNFIDKDIAIKIRDFYSNTQNSESFVQPSKEGNHRIFYYQNSPYKYPKFITSLLNHCMVVKNRIYESHDFYQIYCMIKGVNPKNYSEVARLQNLHSWSSIYWYKNNNSHFRHIDNFGELACFVVFTKKGEDYEGGGLTVEIDNKIVDMDDNYDYGDLVFLDQSKVFHEVLPVKTKGNQIGRMQLYVPTIPPNYMDLAMTFEGYPNKVFFTDENLILENKKELSDRAMDAKGIHYSRKNFIHYDKELL
jgi:hypothetical protein